MRGLIGIFIAVTVSALGQQNLGITGSIFGSLKGEDGTAIAGGVIMLHRSQPATSKLGRQQLDWSVVTSGVGTFQFSDLPTGSYTLCPRVQNSTWLNPCEWSLPTPTVTLSSLTPDASITITLRRGAAVPIRVDDAGQLLAQNEGRTPGAGLLLNVSSPGFFFHPVPLASKDSGGRNYQIVVPFNTALTLVVHPSFYHVNNTNNVSLSQTVSTKIPLFVTAGQQVTPIKFTIMGGGH
jgi:hypothetical protein